MMNLNKGRGSCNLIVIKKKQVEIEYVGSRLCLYYFQNKNISSIPTIVILSLVGLLQSVE